jgi:sulfate transporter 4
MFLGVAIGLTIAVVVSILLVIYESAFPHTAVEGRLPGTTMFRDIKQYPGAERYDGLVIIRIDASLYFANAQTVCDKVRQYKCDAADELAARGGGQVKFLILDMAPVTHVDTTALQILLVEDMFITEQMRGVQICFANPGIDVMEKLVKSGLFDLVGREHFFSSVIDAVDWCFNEMNHDGASQDALDQEASIHNDEE